MSIYCNAKIQQYIKLDSDNILYVWFTQNEMLKVHQIAYVG